jgi:uncharacterized protein
VITAVLDTNILASALRGYTHTYPGVLLRAWHAGHYQLLISDHIIDELRRTLANRYFSQFVNEREAAAVIELLKTEATTVPIIHPVQAVATHPEDDLVIATALSGDADYLVTGDSQLLRIEHYVRTQIISARAFGRILSAASEQS